MFHKLGVLVQIAWRNLFASWLNVIIGFVILGGTFLVVVGGSALDSLDQSMSRSITGSVSGDIQVYSAKSKDELSLFGNMGGADSDLTPLSSFNKVKDVLMKVPNVRAVVPMGADPGPVLAAPVAATAPPTPPEPPKQPPLELTP